MGEAVALTTHRPRRPPTRTPAPRGPSSPASTRARARTRRSPPRPSPWVSIRARTSSAAAELADIDQDETSSSAITAAAELADVDRGEDLELYDLPPRPPSVDQGQTSSSAIASRLSSRPGALRLRRTTGSSNRDFGHSGSATGRSPCPTGRSLGAGRAHAVMRRDATPCTAAAVLRWASR